MKIWAQIVGGAGLLLVLASCMETACKAALLVVDGHAEDAVGQPIADAELRLGVSGLTAEMQPRVLQDPVCSTGGTGNCTGKVHYLYGAPESSLGRFIDRLMMKKPAKKHFYVEFHRHGQMLCRSEIGSLTQKQMWGQERIGLTVRVGSNPCVTAFAIAEVPLGKATERIGLLTESEDLAPALAAVREAVRFKPIAIRYEILEDGTVGGCELMRVDRQEVLAAQVPRELSAGLCQALSKRRYPPGDRVKAEITFGTPYQR